MAKYEALKERALINFDHLLNLWQIEYTKINDIEYDFINPTRKDTNHGACRFNVAKGTGADFAGTGFTSADYQSIGPGFTKEDFAGITRGNSDNWGFDIIGLCQRLHGLNTYQDAAAMLKHQLTDLNSKIDLNKVDPGAKEAREHKKLEYNLKTLKSAERAWSLCVPYYKSLGNNYLKSRNIHLPGEQNIKFHEKIYNTELKTNIPALLFKVSVLPETPLVAIHRIYVAKDGSRKAHVKSQKMALGSIKGAGIWFGIPGPELCIVEGPENALSIRVLGYPFVVCSINATNFSNLSIPVYVKKIILFPDPDEAGKNSAGKAIKAYAKDERLLKLVFPPDKALPNGKKADWNDILCGRGTAV